MDDTIWYLNTDLDLVSPEDMTEISAALASKGVFVLCDQSKGDDGLWYATFEANKQFSEPEPTIAVMLSAIESLDEPFRALWSRCSVREFNIGYDCGSMFRVSGTEEKRKRTCRST